MRIVFFRDGVSEGEYAAVVKEEIGVLTGRSSTLLRDRLTALAADCLKNLIAFQRNGEPDSSGKKAYPPGAVPPVTFIVVGKRCAGLSV